MQYLFTALSFLVLGTGTFFYFFDSSRSQKLVLMDNSPSTKEVSTPLPAKKVPAVKTKVANSSFPLKIIAPELVGLENWINSEEIKSLKDLRGKVILVDFWTYSCINCVHTLPHIQALQDKYADQGLVILGIHAPEFQYEKKLKNVKKAVLKHGLTYPIAQDNNFQTWRAYKNRYWPAQYLIDKKGFVRYSHFGEGAYDKTEKTIQRLLEL